MRKVVRGDEKGAGREGGERGTREEKPFSHFLMNYDSEDLIGRRKV